jgi:hypothetical protein
MPVVDASSLRATPATFAAIEGRKPPAGGVGRSDASELGLKGLIENRMSPAFAGAKPTLDLSDLQKKKDEAERIGEDIKRALSVTAKPVIDASSLDAPGLAKSRAGGTRSALPAFVEMQGAKPTLDLSDLQTKKAQAEHIGEDIKTALSVTAKPTVDASSLDALISKIETAKNGLASLGAQITATSARITGLGKIQRGNFSYGGVQGE